MGLCNVSARVLMIALSFIFWALSAGCMFVAIEFFRFMGPLKGEIVDKMVLLAPVGFMIVLTILLFVIGMIGLCGACQESKCLHGTFCTVLLLIIGIEVAGVVCGIVYKDEVKDELEKNLQSAINHYDENTALTEAVDSLQQAVECCGVKSYKDWFTTKWGKAHPFSVPTSCCKKTGTCSGTIVYLDLINKEGCNLKLYDDIHQYLVIIIAAALMFAIIQMMGLGCTCYLMCKTREIPYQTLNSDTSGYSA